MTRLLMATTAVGLVLAAAGDVAKAQDFRVYPYLQQPSKDGMLINWFTETGTPGTLTVSGGDLSAPLVWTSSPSYQPLLEYTQAERAENVGPGVDLDLISDDNYKHSVPVSGLTPNTTYTYSVEQNGGTFSRQFNTAPSRDDWQKVRFIALADSETQPQGRTTNRTWFTGAQHPNSLGRPASLPGGAVHSSGAPFNQYLLSETEGYKQNLRIVSQRKPDFIVFPGDIVQGGGYQPGWDEWFRHNAGEFGTPVSEAPVLPALGNWENFGGSTNGGYTIDPATGRNEPKRARDKYKVYFDQPANKVPEHQDNYYRVDYGPITILTLDSSNGEPDQIRRDPNAKDIDTQHFINADTYRAAGGNDLSDFNQGSAQWNWVVEQLEDARNEGQVVFAQYHHIAYSTGGHSLPMNHPASSGQQGTPMRIYQELFEEYGVAGVLSGHNEMFERSFVDENGDGFGINYYDVGVAGDGFGVPLHTITTNEALGLTIDDLNPFRAWNAHLDEGELWQEVTDADGNTYVTLIDGGKHYGHLEINLEKLPEDSEFWALLTLTPVYSFPIVDENWELLGETERRIYGDVVELYIGFDGVPVFPAAVPVPVSGLTFLAGVAGLLVFRRR